MVRQLKWQIPLWFGCMNPWKVRGDPDISVCLYFISHPYHLTLEVGYVCVCMCVYVCVCACVCVCVCVCVHWQIVVRIENRVK